MRRAAAPASKLWNPCGKASRPTSGPTANSSPPGWPCGLIMAASSGATTSRPSCASWGLPAARPSCGNQRGTAALSASSVPLKNSSSGWSTSARSRSCARPCSPSGSATTASGSSLVMATAPQRPSGRRSPGRSPHDYHQPSVHKIRGSTIDANTIRRDALKNAICEKLGMPLLRIDAGFFRRIPRFSILGWLTELWFMNEDFERQQRDGIIAADEILHYSFLLAAIRDGKLVPSEYDPFRSSRIRLINWLEKGLCGMQEQLHGQDPKGYWVALTVVPLPTGGAIIGQGRCRSYTFPPISPLELAHELSVLDAAATDLCAGL